MQICRLEMNEKATGFNQIFTLIKACSYLKFIIIDTLFTSISGKKNVYRSIAKYL